MKIVTLSLDVEASGPIPGPWWMCSFGICRTDDVQCGKRWHLKPLQIPGISQPDVAGAMAVVATGVPDLGMPPTAAPGSPPLALPGVSPNSEAGSPPVGEPGSGDDPHSSPARWPANEETVQRVRSWFEVHGVPPLYAMQELKKWLCKDLRGERPVIVGSPVTFDFMWLYWYWWYFMKSMPPFGFSGLDVRSYFMGSHGVGFPGTGKRRYLAHYPNEFRHTHDPLDDARQQGRIWDDMVRARESRPK